MLHLFRSLFAKWSRTAWRRKGAVVRPSPRLRLFLEPLDDRIVPSNTATQVLAGTTLSITEYHAFNDTVSETSAFGGHYTFTDSAGTFNVANVANIVFTAASTGVSVIFGNSGGFSTTGNVSINGLGNFNGLSVNFDGTFNVSGKVTVTNTGSGSTTDFTDLGNHLGGLTVTGGAAVSGKNTFVNISDTIHNASGTHSIQGTLVDLEGATINGATTINFGAGGGYFLTNYTLDLGNAGNDAVNTAPAKVQFNGDLTITDLRTLTDDTFELFSANVAGNVSINVSALGASQLPIINSGIGGIRIMNYSIGKNLSVTTLTPAADSAELQVFNSAVHGAAAVTQSGGADGYAELYYSSVNGGVTVNQSTANSYFYVNGSNGSQANTLGGTITLKQSGANDSVDLFNLSAVKGALSVTQSGVGENDFNISNDNTINGSIAVTQSPAFNSVVIGDDGNVSGAVSINQSASSGAGNISIYNAALAAGLTVTQALANSSAAEGAIFSATNISIKGNVNITQGAGYANSVAMDQTYLTAGALVINQSSSVAQYDDVQIENGSSINGSLTVTQASTPAQASVEVAGNQINESVNINGNVSITQTAANAGAALGYGASFINGSVTVTQNAGTQSSAEIYNETVKGLVKLSQTGAGGSQGYVEDSSVGGTVTANQNQVAQENIFDLESTTVNGSVAISQATNTNFTDFYEYNIFNIELYDDQINGSVTISHGANNGGYYTVALVEDVAITGNLSVNQTGGYTNILDINDSTAISGSLTVNQSAATTDENELVVGGNVEINGSVTVTQPNGSESYVEFSSNTAIKGAVTIAQGGTFEDEIQILNTSAASTVTVTQGTGYDAFYVENQSILAGNVSVTGKSKMGSYDVIENSSLSKNLTIVEGVGSNSLYIANNAAVIGNVSANLGGTSNFVDIYDATIFGTTILNLGIGLTGANTVDIQSDDNAKAKTAFHGTVTVGMGDGINTVNVGENGSATFMANASFAANISGHNTYNSSNTSGAGIVTFRNF